MIGLDSLGLEQLQTIKTQIETQITTYKTILTAARTQYSNCMEKLASAKETLGSAKSTFDNAKSNFNSTIVDSPIPGDLLEVPSSSPDVAISSVEVAGLQISKINAEDKISKYQEKLNKLNEWKVKIENKIKEYQDKLQQLQQKAMNYVGTQIQNAKDFAVNQGTTAMSKVSNVVSNTQKQITKTTSGATNKVTTTITKKFDSNLIKK